MITQVVRITTDMQQLEIGGDLKTMLQIKSAMRKPRHTLSFGSDGITVDISSSDVKQVEYLYYDEPPNQGL